MKTCPVCHESMDPSFVRKWKEYELFLCSSCDVIYSIPFIAPGRDWYEDSYKMFSLMSRASWHHERFLEHRPAGKTLLDVGCNNGYFIHLASRLGYDVTGLDFNREAIESGKRDFGLEKLYSYNLEEFSSHFPDMRFDIITMFEVIEHLDDPDAFMKGIKKLLAPGGLVAVSVPHRGVINPLGYSDYPPHHLTKWSAMALQNFISGQGFSTITHEIRNVQAEDFARWFDTNIIRKFDEPLRNMLKKKALSDAEHMAGSGTPEREPWAVKLRKLQLGFLKGVFFVPSLALRLMGGKGSSQFMIARFD